jgi:hypothetical protein
MREPTIAELFPELARELRKYRRQQGALQEAMDRRRATGGLLRNPKSRRQTAPDLRYDYPIATVTRPS